MAFAVEIGKHVAHLINTHVLISHNFSANVYDSFTCARSLVISSNWNFCKVVQLKPRSNADDSWWELRRERVCTRVRNSTGIKSHQHWSKFEPAHSWWQSMRVGRKTRARVGTSTLTLAFVESPERNFPIWPWLESNFMILDSFSLISLW